MEAQRTSLREQYNTRYLLLAALKSAAGALLLALACYLAFRSWRRVRRFFHLRILEKRSLIPHNWRRFLGNIESRLYALLVILLGVLAGYVWLSWVFSLFPWTRVWGESLGEVVGRGDSRYFAVHRVGAAGIDDSYCLSF